LSSTSLVEYILFDLTIENIEKFNGIYSYQISYSDVIHII